MYQLTGSECKTRQVQKFNFTFFRLREKEKHENDKILMYK